MNWKTYFLKLTKSERAIYAGNCNTSPGYIQNHLISKRKIPQPKLMKRLAEATNGACSEKDVLDHFYNFEKNQQ